jgi:hypothetical protein
MIHELGRIWDDAVVTYYPRNCLEELANAAETSLRTAYDSTEIQTEYLPHKSGNTNLFSPSLIK